MKKWYQIADVCVLPSYTEQCSYFGIEMLAHGKLILATDGHNMGEMFHPNTALIVKTDSEKEIFAKRLEEAMESMLRIKPSNLKKMRKSARIQFDQKYTLSYMKVSYMKLVANAH